MEDKRLKNLAEGRKKLAEMRAKGIPTKRKQAPKAAARRDVVTSSDSQEEEPKQLKKAPKAEASAKKRYMEYLEHKQELKASYKAAVKDLKQYYE
jgi:hypothetical protein